MFPNTNQVSFLLWVHVICLTFPDVSGEPFSGKTIGTHSLDYHEGCNIEDKIDYYGHDIKNKTTQNYQECADFSVSISEGLFWTWNKETNMCHVKNKNEGKQQRCAAISGNKKCGCKIEKNIDYYGYDLKDKKKKLNNQQQCADYAASIPEGYFWTWNKEERVCRVKSENVGKKENKDGNSGNYQCGLKPAVPLGKCPCYYTDALGDVGAGAELEEFEPEIDFKYVDLIYGIGNIDACARFCDAKSSCCRFDYSPIHKVCNLNFECETTDGQWDGQWENRTFCIKEPRGRCPISYIYVHGDIESRNKTAPLKYYRSSSNGIIYSFDNIYQCAGRCDDKPNCCSFEFNTEQKLCTLNYDCDSTDIWWKKQTYCIKGNYTPFVIT